MLARAAALGIVVVASIAALAPAAAAEGPVQNLHFNIELSGAAERPNPVETEAHGRAVIEVRLRGGEIESFHFLLIACRIENATVAHIHAAAGPDGTAPPVLFLLHSGGQHSADGCMRLNGARLDAAELEGRLVNTDMDGFAAALLSGSAYVNVHTTGHPAGEIRGQVA